MTPPSQVKWFTMREKVGKAPAWLRDYIRQELDEARRAKPRSERRSFYIGIARGTAGMWPSCNGGGK